MSESITYLHALKLLSTLRWHTASDPLPSAFIQSWLYETESMTARFETYLKSITIELVRQEFVSDKEIIPEAAHLPNEKRYWLREIVLKGDGIPLLAGRTVIPSSTLVGSNRQLQQIGTQPLGHFLFSLSPCRDLLEIGSINRLWGRRTHWLLGDKPLLLTELFLPDAPLYATNQSNEETND